MPTNQPPRQCPVCNEGHPYADGDQWEDFTCYIYMLCRLCDASWTEVYVFDHYALNDHVAVAKKWEGD